MLSDILALASLIISVSLAIAAIFLYRKISPSLNEAQAAISKGMSVLGNYGNIVKADKALEGGLEAAIFGDISKQFPELELLAGVSPATYEYIKENPQAVMTLLSRYGGYIQPLLQRMGKGGGGKDNKPFDY